jgi:predicted PurR-regulated permease PerM
MLAGIGLGLVMWLLGPVLAPFAAGALLAYLGDPLADRLEALRVPRTAAVALVFAGLFLVLTLVALLILPLLERQIAALANKLPEYLRWAQEHALPLLRDVLGMEESLDLQALGTALKEHWEQAGGFVAALVGSVTRSSGVLVGWVANILLIPVVTFYLLRDWDLLVATIRHLLPRRIEPVVSELATESDEVLGAFLRGQLLVMLGQGVIYSIGLWLVGLDFALLIGMFAGLVSFVPYLGAIVGVLTAGLAAYFQFQELWQLLPVFLVFGVGQLVEGMLLTPWLVGDRIGLHPVAVIFAVLAGGQLFGFLGVLVALPVAAVVMVLLRHTRNEYMRSALYAQSGTHQPEGSPAAEAGESQEGDVP